MADWIMDVYYHIVSLCDIVIKTLKKICSINTFYLMEKLYLFIIFQFPSTQEITLNKHISYVSMNAVYLLSSTFSFTANYMLLPFNFSQ